MARWLAAAAPALLVVSVLYARCSGNDKAPFVVVGVLGLTAVLAVALLLRALVVGSLHAWRSAALAMLPLLYAAIAIALARQGWVDLMSFLGFR
ncbi:cadmium resistance protein CadD (predicted permease) [Massilia sp. UYP11]|uniref:hypothetical protein n=1 Tax=Massilia sp. UYP11 TaxID=1756385 RepID=UPI003D1AA32F